MPTKMKVAERLELVAETTWGSGTFKVELELTYIYRQRRSR
jgi:hypothetical protein